jgi:LuxR family transcriptional regulator, positive regulator of biofilm formation
MKQQQSKSAGSAALRGRTIYIVGGHVLGNQALGRMIESDTGARCVCLKSMDDVSGDQHAAAREDLILLDCLGKHTDDFVSGLLASLYAMTDLAFVALFNVQPGTGIEESCMSHGVRGLFYEDSDSTLFIKGIHAIFQNELWFSRDVMTRYILDEHNEENAALTIKNVLTQREIEILSHVAVGCKNEEIADKLCVSPHTIKTHLYNIYKKINVTSRLQATLWAAKNL